MVRDRPVDDQAPFLRIKVKGGAGRAHRSLNSRFRPVSVIQPLQLECLFLPLAVILMCQRVPLIPAKKQMDGTQLFAGY